MYNFKGVEEEAIIMHMVKTRLGDERSMQWMKQLKKSLQSLYFLTIV